MIRSEPAPHAAGSTFSRRTERDRLKLPPALVDKWQVIVDTMAELVDVPAGLIMRLDGAAIAVCVTSRSAGNPYHAGEAETWDGSGLYCEAAIKSGLCLLVPDARADADWCTNPDLSRGMVSYLGYPIRWPDEQPFGTICVLDTKPNGYDRRYRRLIEQFRDLIEHQLELVCRDIDRRLAARRDRRRQAAVLAKSQSRLRQAEAELAHVSHLSEIGLFAGALVHEISQPLAAMSTSAAACLRWLERDDPQVEEACATLRNAAAAARRAADMIGGLRSLARKAPVTPEEFDLQILASETATMLREPLHNAGIAVNLSIPPAARKALGERVQIQLVLHNLMRNAIESMVGVSDRRRRLTIAADRCAEGSIVVYVDDTGVGLEPDVAVRILRSPFTTKASGMGMGLTICRSIVEAHGGEITADPNPHGPGVRFAFTLPAAPAPAAAGPSRPL